MHLTPGQIIAILVIAAVVIGAAIMVLRRPKDPPSIGGGRGDVPNRTRNL